MGTAADRWFAVLGASGLSLLLAGCAGTGGGPRVPAIPVADSPAARVFVDRCGVCHDVPHPARHDYAGWRYLVPVMERHMAERGMRGLSADERAAILGYLQKFAR